MDMQMLDVIYPVFMPIMDMRRGVLACYEVLMRTKAPNTNHFALLRHAEQYGFIHLLDREMLGHAINYLGADPALRLSINVSVRTIERYMDDYIGLIPVDGALVGRLVFEITETIKIEQLHVVSQFADAVRGLGGKVAIDDFGSGFFSIEEVMAIRPDLLKLGQDFIDQIPQRKREIERLISMARDFGGSCVAEHVDSKEKFIALNNMGMAFSQGYLWGEAQPFDQLPDKSSYEIQYQNLLSNKKPSALTEALLSCQIRISG